MDPETHTKEQIAKDNWHGLAQWALKEGKMDWVIKIHDLTPVTCFSQRKGVFLYEGHVNLNDFRHTIGRSNFSESDLISDLNLLELEDELCVIS